MNSASDTSQIYAAHTKVKASKGGGGGGGGGSEVNFVIFRYYVVELGLNFQMFFSSSIFILFLRYRTSKFEVYL